MITFPLLRLRVFGLLGTILVTGILGAQEPAPTPPPPLPQLSVASDDGLIHAVRKTKRLWQGPSAGLRSADLGIWFDGESTEGLVIASVGSEGAVAQIGLAEGDRIVSVNGRPVLTEAEFLQTLFAGQVGEEGQVDIVVFRSGGELPLQVRPALLRQEVATVDPLWQAGIVLDESTPDRLVVQRIVPRTPAFYWGLQPGDVIDNVGGQPVSTVAELAQLLQSKSDSILAVNRGDRIRELAIEPLVQAQLPLPVRTAQADPAIRLQASQILSRLIDAQAAPRQAGQLNQATDPAAVGELPPAPPPPDQPLDPNAPQPIVPGPNQVLPPDSGAIAPSPNQPLVIPPPANQPLVPGATIIVPRAGAIAPGTVRPLTGRTNAISPRSGRTAAEAARLNRTDRPTMVSPSTARPTVGRPNINSRAAPMSTPTPARALTAPARPGESIPPPGPTTIVPPAGTALPPAPSPAPGGPR